MNDKTLRTQCCSCRRVLVDNDWLPVKPDPRRWYSHGYCPECLRTEMARWDRWIAQHPAKPSTAPMVADGRLA